MQSKRLYEALAAWAPLPLHELPLEDHTYVAARRISPSGEYIGS
jgi:hypothetical protein